MDWEWISREYDVDGNLLKGKIKVWEPFKTRPYRLNIDFVEDVSWKPGFKPKWLIEKDNEINNNIDTMNIFKNVFKGETNEKNNN